MRVGRVDTRGMRGAVLEIACLVFCFPVVAQQRNSVTPLLAALKSTDWNRRYAAYEKIKNNQEVLKRPDVRAALSDLLDSENKVIHETLTSESSPSVDEKYGEEYSEYVADLVDTVSKIANWRSPREVCILARSPYNPDSPFAGKLAVEGGLAVAPCLLEMVMGNRYDRDQAIPVLVHLSAVTRDLSPTIQNEIRETIVGGLHDSRVSVREATVEAVGRFGTSDLIPTLQQIARSDPFSKPVNEGKDRSYDVRELAKQAIASIQERAKQR